jgi:hypothetical protein
MLDRVGAAKPVLRAVIALEEFEGRRVCRRALSAHANHPPTGRPVRRAIVVAGLSARCISKI